MKKSIYLYIIAILLLCACTAKAPATMSSDGYSEVTSDEPGIDDDFENDLGNNTFISDYLPGEENLVGNLWTNRMFCRQGDYIYHFNEAEKRLEKWRSDEGIENAEVICYVDTKMLPVEEEHSPHHNHLEVVGDYIYLCLMTGDRIGDAELTTIVCYRTDGKVQATLATDCANCQYRIINNTLFYLTVVHYQEDMSTEKHCIAIKSLDLESFDPANPDTDPQELALRIRESTTQIPNPTRVGEIYPTKLFVLEDGEKYIIGYQYPWQNNWISLRYTVEENSDFVGYTTIDYQNEVNVGVLYCVENNGNLLIRHDNETLSVNVDSWPNDIQSVETVLSKKQYLMCASEDFIFFENNDYTLCALNRSTGEQWKINNDDPSKVDFVDDGKIYYYVFDDSKYNLCVCNLDGSGWMKINSYGRRS